jgi:hypothetical protein
VSYRGAAATVNKHYLRAMRGLVGAMTENNYHWPTQYKFLPYIDFRLLKFVSPMTNPSFDATRAIQTQKDGMVGVSDPAKYLLLLMAA